MSKNADPRPKLKDVARIAGVGTATVDRVLNERGNVSEEVRQKVIEAARSIGLRRQLPPSYKRLIRINLILARPDLPLLKQIADEFRNITNALDCTSPPCPMRPQRPSAPPCVRRNVMRSWSMPKTTRSSTMPSPILPRALCQSSPLFLIYQRHNGWPMQAQIIMQQGAQRGFSLQK
jgi:hypothetical protein